MPVIASEGLTATGVITSRGVESVVLCGQRSASAADVDRQAFDTLIRLVDNYCAAFDVYCRIRVNAVIGCVDREAAAAHIEEAVGLRALLFIRVIGDMYAILIAARCDGDVGLRDPYAVVCLHTVLGCRDRVCSSCKLHVVLADHSVACRRIDCEAAASVECDVVLCEYGAVDIGVSISREASAVCESIGCAICKCHEDLICRFHVDSRRIAACDRCILEHDLHLCRVVCFNDYLPVAESTAYDVNALG